MRPALFSIFLCSILVSSFSALLRKAYINDIHAIFDESEYDIFEDNDLIPEVDGEKLVKAASNHDLKGGNCEYISVCDIVSNSQCSDGQKFVIRKANGTRKQFLIIQDQLVLGFIRKGKKFSSCVGYTDITEDVSCKHVSGLDDVSLDAADESSSQTIETTNTPSNLSPSSSNTSSNSSLRSFEDEEILVIEREVDIYTKIVDGTVIKGEHCDLISVCEITKNSGCSTGSKFVIKRASKQVRKQFVILNGKPVLGFITRGQHFSSCSSYTEITTSISCKVVEGLGSVDLSQASAENSSPPEEEESSTLAAAPDTTIASVEGNSTDSSNSTNGNKKAVCQFKGDGSGNVLGSVLITGSGSGPTTFQLNLTGLAPGKHGFHVHSNGDLSSACVGAGGHFNPFNKSHSGPTSSERHVGDLGNVEADGSGNVVTEIVDNQATVDGNINIIGKAIVIHEGEDDLGQGGDSGSLATGNAGGRAGCCLIEAV